MVWPESVDRTETVAPHTGQVNHGEPPPAVPRGVKVSQTHLTLPKQWAPLTETLFAESRAWHAVKAGASEAQRPLLGAHPMAMGVLCVWFNGRSGQQGSGQCRLNLQLDSRVSSENGPLPWAPTW